VTQPPFTIGIVQDHADPDPRANVARAERLVRAAAVKGAQIICLKELFHSQYFCKSQQSARFELAEPIPGPTTEVMQRLARELAVVLIVPLFERQAAGVYRNSAAVIDADGALLGAYRKMHIPDDPLFNEKYYFTPGDAHPAPQGDRPGEAGGFRVWQTRYATIGVLICWDQWYPEAARITALLGAQVLFYPTAIGWHPSEKDEWGLAQVDAWRTIQREPLGGVSLQFGQGEGEPITEQRFEHCADWLARGKRGSIHFEGSAESRQLAFKTCTDNLVVHASFQFAAAPTCH
jgi:N-carbamoylputrescine amidase